jgi:peptidylprolyl isomerase
MNAVVNGLFVSVEYTGTLNNGDIFDSSRGRRPLEVEIGAGQLINGFEDALMGMTLNEKKTFTIAPEDAYGQRNEDYVRTFNRAEIPPELNLEVGQTLALNTDKGHQIPARVTHLDDEKMIVDMNHPLAGEALTFAIEVVGISDTPTQDQTGCGCGCESEGDCSSGCC